MLNACPFDLCYKDFLLLAKDLHYCPFRSLCLLNFTTARAALCKWRHGCFEAGGLIAQFPPLARAPRAMGEAADKASRNSSLLLYSSPDTKRRDIWWCFLRFPTSLSLLSAWKANMFYWLLWACEGLWRNLPEWVLREFLLQLLLEGLNPVSTVTVSLRQTKHPPASFPARPY